MFVRTHKGEYRRGNLHATSKWQQVSDSEYFDAEELIWREDDDPPEMKAKKTEKDETNGKD